jgi:hypothetical protein
MPCTYSSESAVASRRPKRRHPFAGALAALLLLPVTAPGFTPQGGDASSGLPRVTIEASKERQALRRRVNKFVTAVVVQPENESLIRWNAPICPLVAGLPRNIGEFMLARISQAALAARAPLRTDTDGGGVPTILRLFRDPKPPDGLTPWDRALLYSLYNTSQSGKLQLIDMEVTMVKRIAP